MTIYTETAELRLAEQQIRTALAEKEILLREVHHRVKTNLAVVSSLLYLQASASQDERVQTAFADCQRRIQTMALIHEQIYRSQDLARIEMGSFLAKLADDLSFAFSSRGANFLLEVKDIEICLDQAIPCGLIINELVTNALKFAFPVVSPGQKNIISVSLCKQDGRCILKVGDNGVGLPAGFPGGPTGGLDRKRPKRLGWKLVNRLADQLGGAVEVESAPGRGTSFRISFPLTV